MSAGFLERMASSSAARVAEAKARVAERELRARALDTRRPPRLLLASEGFDLIAELKLRSPAAGRLAASGEGGSADEVAARVRDYVRGGAAAVSVLTEPARFDGSLEHLEVAARALGVPAMRKDFLVDPYQVLEARAAGAGGVLVILRMLTQGAAAALLDCARELGLFVLLEAFDEADIERAHAIIESHSDAARAPLLVGVNCRDLDTLKVVPGRLEALADSLPRNVPRVAESGVASAEDAARVAAAGYDLALVGSALMGAGEPAELVRDLLVAGRGARRGAKRRGEAR
ncbi:MAG TPA: indole-3-glycerol-phosphate synthase [Steroidobacteraceae bacterium]|nr:indole-3-glycerol-phosphate synthase [Steroidobacteraceae bacterium]